MFSVSYSNRLTQEINECWRSEIFNVPVVDAQKIKDYSEFAAQTRRKKIKKLLDTRITNKEIRTLGGLIRYTEKKTMDISKDIEIYVKDLQENMEKEVGQKFDSDAIVRIKDFSLISFTGEGDELKVKFSPKLLSHTLSHISVYKKISGMNSGNESLNIRIQT